MPSHTRSCSAFNRSCPSDGFTGRHDSPAASAGLKKGDVITDIDGERVDSALALVAQVRQRTTGDEVVLGYVRDGERHEVTVTLDARPDDQQQ